MTTNITARSITYLHETNHGCTSGAGLDVFRPISEIWPRFKLVVLNNHPKLVGLAKFVEPCGFIDRFTLK